MNLAARLGLAALVPVALVIAASAWQAALVERLAADNRALARIDRGVDAAAFRIRDRAALHADRDEKARLLEDPAYEAAAAEARGEVEAELGALRALVESGDPPVDPAVRAAAGGVERAWAATRAGSAPEGALGASIDALAAAGQGAAEARVAAAEIDARRVARVARGAAIGGALAALLLSVALGVAVVRPVRRIARATREVADGRFDRRVDPGGGPELSALAADFNAMAERLGALDALKEEILSNASHDLKAPLASMRETTRLLLDEIPGPLTADQRRLLELDLKCGERLSSMIADLLDLSRIDAGAWTLARASCDVGDLVEDVADELRPLAVERGVRVEVQGNGASPVECDQGAVVRVLQNLVANAIQHAPRGTAVRVAVADGGGGARIEVVDGGPGIPDAEKPLVFERFHGRGTGLGLSIARSLVEAHGGSIAVADGPGGRGTAFTVRLPGPA